MEESLRELFIPDFSKEEAGNYSPLVLAFIGDAAYELAIRSMVVKQANRPVNELNRMKNKYVKAAAQSAMIEKILPELEADEAAVYKRGRNARSYTMAKNATMADYRRATGFEALMGYLYLEGKIERLLELVRKGMEDGQN